MTIATVILLLIFLILGFVYLVLQIAAAKFPKARMFNHGIFSVMCLAMLLPVCFLLVTGFLSFCYLFPAYIFYDTFKFVAPSDVSELKGSHTLLGKDEIWLEFNTGKQTASKILTADYAVSEKEKYQPDNEIFNDFVDHHAATIYADLRNNNKNRTFKRWIAYDETTGRIFYYQTDFYPNY